VSGAVLLVEDNPSDEKLTIRAFRNAGLPNEVVVAHDGVEALERLHGAAGGAGAGMPPALVLLDLKLPKVDGLEMLRRLRADPRTKHLPVVVLTASREEEDVVRSYAFGANAYVRKPIDFQAFVEAARTIGLFWLGLNEPPPRGAP
jgi:two-component system response regulator